MGNAIISSRCIIAATMKFSVGFLVAIAVSGVANVNAVPVKTSSELHGVFEEFLALVPKDKVVEIFMEYLANDAEVQKAVAYVSSDEFKKLLTKIESIEDVKNFFNYLQNSGLDVYGAVNKLHEAIGLPPIVTGKSSPSARITGGVAGLWQDVKAVLPIDKIKALYYEKLATSPAFAELVKRLSSPRFQELINALRANLEFRKIIGFLKEAGINVAAIADVLTTMFGLDFSNERFLTKPAFFRVNPDLVEDLADFVALLPLDDMAKVAAEYVANDPEVQKAAAYLKSEEFKVLATNAEQNDEFRAFVSYLDEAGLPAFHYVNLLNSYLGLPEVKLPQAAARSVLSGGKGVRGMIDAIEALLPRDAIETMYRQKLQSSSAFISMMRHLTSPEFQHAVDQLVQNPEFKKFGFRAAEFGIDVSAIGQFMSKVFGIDIHHGALA